MNAKLVLAIVLLTALLLVSCAEPVRTTETESETHATHVPEPSIAPETEAIATASPVAEEAVIDAPEPTVRQPSSLNGSDVIESTPTPEIRYFRKFQLILSSSSEDKFVLTNWDNIGDTFPATPYTISSDRAFPIRVLQDGRIAIENHDGEAHRAIIDITTTQWDDFGIQVFLYAGDLTLLGGREALTGLPEFHEDEFRFPLATDGNQSESSREYEMQYIMHHEISGSALLRALEVTDLIEITEFYGKFYFYMWDLSVGGTLITTWADSNDTQPATPYTYSLISDTRRYQIIALPDGRIATKRNDGEPSPVADITTTQWDDFRIQVFRFAGDITLIGRRRALTNIREFHEDDFHFPMQRNARDMGRGGASFGREFQIQYIMRHEISDSALCRLLGIEPCD